MNVYCYTFPINNYHGDGIFWKQVYFQGDNCPTHEQVVKRLEELANQDYEFAKRPSFGPICHEYEQCLQAIQLIERRSSIDDPKLPWLGHFMAMTNTFTMHPKWGRQPITAEKIVLHDVTKPIKSYFDGD